MREQIIETVANHLRQLDAKYFHWLGRPLDNDEFPAIVMNDTESNIDDDSGHTLKIEISVILSDGVDSTIAKDTRVLMQQVSFAIRDALEEICLFGKLRKTKLDAQSSEFAYIAGVMLFEIRYTADEWSI